MLRHKTIILAAFLPFVIATWNLHAQTILNWGKEIALRLTPSVGNPRNSEGDFVSLKNGRILFVYTHFTGGSGDNAPSFLAGRFSEDGGRTWNKKDITILPNEGKMNIMSVSLLRLHSGKIALFYLRKNSLTDCIPFMRLSSDEAQSWSKPQRCIRTPGYYVMNNDRAVQLASGRIILPVALHNTPEENHFSNGRIFCYFSDDNGETWHRSQQVPNPQNITSEEPGVVPLADGRLMLFCRTTAGSQFISFSSDQGEHWLPLKPSSIRSPRSPASIERIPTTGDLLLVWNNTYDPDAPGGGDRTPLTLAISRDEGKTWQKVKTIEDDPKGWYCYTAIEWVGNHVLLGHCAGNRRKYNGLETTQITRLSLEWVYADATPDPSVAFNRNGVVKLTCPEKHAEIHFTRNGRLPGPESPVYSDSIRVHRPTRLLFRAYSPDHPPSALVNAVVGQDVLQDPWPVKNPLKPGLRFAYFEGVCRSTSEISGLPLIQSGICQRFSINRRKRDRDFAFVFKGFLTVAKTGVYKFWLLSNDGSTLFLDGLEILNNDGPHWDKEVSGAIGLKPGFHRVVVKYFQMGGEKSFRLLWKGPGFEKQQIPMEALSHETGDN